MKKNKMTLKEWAKQPYTKGDYYGSVALVLGLYGLAFAGYLIYNKVTDWQAAKVGKELPSESIDTIREAYMDEPEEDEA